LIHFLIVTFTNLLTISLNRKHRPTFFFVLKNDALRYVLYVITINYSFLQVIKKQPF